MLTVIILIATGALVLVAIGVIIELNAHSRIEVWPEPDFNDDISASPRKDGFFYYFGKAVRQHPRPPLATIETFLWLLFLVPLIDHVASPADSFTGSIIWALIIGPHEVGHLICMPFGEFLMVAGGSIWQVLFWLLLGGYSLVFKRRLVQSLLLFMVVGHSFINLSVYIGDAQERDLPLLFGLGPESHDWGNLLEWTGMLNYDDTLAALAVIIGAIIVLMCLVSGILSTWMLPNAR